MKLIRGIYNLDSRFKSCVATWGNFDGVHLGHQAIIKRVVETANKLSCPSLLITTEPLSHEYFLKNNFENDKKNRSYRLMHLREKLKAIEELGIDAVLCLRFNKIFTELPAEQFIQTVLVDTLNIQHLIIGDDTRFGKNRQGDFSLLQTTGKTHNFTVENSPTLNDDKKRISSSRIRELLAKGDIKTANQLLGKPYSISGRIVHGDKRGRELGFPTANIHIPSNAKDINKKPLLEGVFAVTVSGLKNNKTQNINAVANLGIRPTFNGKEYRVEIHLLDFKQDIYGQYIDVHFLEKIRNEKKYNSVEALTLDIKKDIEKARRFFNQ